MLLWPQVIYSQDVFGWDFTDALDFQLYLGIRQNIICQLLPWTISPKFSPSKILYRTVVAKSLKQGVWRSPQKLGCKA